MANLTNFGANLAATAVLSSTLYVSLHTGDPGADGDQNELTVENGYARVAVDFTVTGRLADNDAAVVFGPKTGGAVIAVTHWAIHDDSTNGNAHMEGAVSADRNWDTGDLTVPADDFDVNFL